MIKYHAPDDQPELINTYVRNTRLAMKTGVSAILWAMV